MALPRLNTEGFLITEIANTFNLQVADFGEGYQRATNVGAPEGRRSWRIQIDVIPGDGSAILRTDENAFLLAEGGGYTLTEGGGRIILDLVSTRAAYLWRFFRASKSRGDGPFLFEVEDPAIGDTVDYIANFADDRLTYAVLCAQVYGTGLELIERRLPAETVAALKKRRS